MAAAIEAANIDDFPDTERAAQVCRLRMAWLARDSRLPALELLEQGVLFLLRHVAAAGSDPALVDKAREHQPDILGVRGRRDAHVALQPLRRRPIAPPSRQVGGKVDFAPLRVMTRRQ